MKIQSISNIITNSSSEVFMVVDIDSIDSLKQTVQKLVETFGVKENVDDIFEFEPVLNYDIEYQINHMILTGYLNRDIYGPSEVGTEENQYCEKVNGYPVCQNEAEITDEIFDKAMYDFVKANNDCDYQYDFCPVLRDIEIKAKKPEYEDMAKAIDNLLHCMDYEERNT